MTTNIKDKCVYKTIEVKGKGKTNIAKMELQDGSSRGCEAKKMRQSQIAMYKMKISEELISDTVARIKLKTQSLQLFYK